MKIACLGWGSLIWKPGALPVQGEWKADGPFLAIEFCRMSDGGELATALCNNAAPVPTLWAWLDCDSLELASQALKEREEIPQTRHDGIGSLVVQKTSIGPLAEWAIAREIEAVIWTALPPRGARGESHIPTVEETIAYLDGLSGKTREHAKSYHQSVPAQIDTAYRRAITVALGWYPQPVL